MKRGTTAAATKAPTFGGYLATLNPVQRRALGQLRRAIRAAAPQAEEGISYGLPAFRLNGKLLVALGAAKQHCAFYPGSIVRAFKKELAGYNTSTGTIRFPATTPLPATLVRKIVKARMAQRGAEKSG